MIVEATSGELGLIDNIDNLHPLVIINGGVKLGRDASNMDRLWYKLEIGDLGILQVGRWETGIKQMSLGDSPEPLCQSLIFIISP